MKRILLLAAAATLTNGAFAQTWMEPSAEPRKLDDVVAAYERSKGTEGRAEVKSKVKEGKDYHFSRWEWYWRHHLDENGYMVSPVRNFNEWQAFKKRQAQKSKYSKTTQDQSQWTFNGPTQTFGGNSGLGRLNVIEFHPIDSNTFIIGSAGGGAWRTTNGGVNWTSLYDNLPVLGVSDVDYNPLNPNTIYLCTGDRDAGDTYSVGVLKSYDGGTTWDTTGLQFLITASSQVLTNALVINPLDTNSITVATSMGIWKSYDAGATWVSTTGAGHYKQVEYNPIDTNVLYSVSYINGGSQIYRSEDGGLNWNVVTNLTDSRRIVLAVTPANPAIVKAVVANMNAGLNGIFSSSDTGKTFTRIFGSTLDCSTNILSGSTNLSANSCSGQGWYDISIAISPIDPNKVIVGGISTWQSLDGGYNWQIVNRAYYGAPGIMNIHADKHYHKFHPLSPNTLFECNDGGLHKSSGTNLVWSDLSNGLGITQFYRVATADNATFVLGGSQDNGTKRVTFAGGSNPLTGGDGMDCQIDPSNSSTFYTSSQYGNINRTFNNGQNYTNISDNIPGNPTGDWITPFILHPNDPSTLYAGYVHLYRSDNRGTNWTDITPTLSPNGSLIRRIAMTPQDDDLIYFVSGNSTIRYTTNHGNNWSVLTGTTGYVTDIAINPKDKNHIFVTYSGYSSQRIAEYRVGIGWKSISDSLPRIPVHCIAIDSSNGTLYVGTDFGVFYRDHTMDEWAPFNNDLPTVEVTDLGINYATNEIWASTYGRGMWKSPRHIAVPNGISNVPYALDVISVAPNPNNGNFSVMTSNKALIGENTTIRIISFTGALVMQTEGKFDNSGTVSANSGNLARGTYIVEVNKAGKVFARTKMVIM